MTSHLAQPVLQKETSLTSIMNVLSAEFLEICSISSDLQETMSPVLINLACSHEHHAKIQMLDLLTQRLEALAVFIDALGKSSVIDGVFDLEAAVSKITLSDVAWRLSGRPRSIADQEAGAVDFF